jgi:nucleotide-binding universal stress UspA family protein
MQTILVAVDESGAAPHAAAVAADLAAAFGARLVAVSVTDGGSSVPTVVPAVQRQVRSLGRELGIDVDVRSSHGSAEEELVRQIRDVAADLVVVAAGDLPGSAAQVAEQVLARCRVPVLVVPPES